MYDNELKTKETKFKPRMKVNHNKATIVLSVIGNVQVSNVCLFIPINNFLHNEVFDRIHENRSEKFFITGFRFFCLSCIPGGGGG